MESSIPSEHLYKKYLIGSIARAFLLSDCTLPFKETVILPEVL